VYAAERAHIESTIPENLSAWECTVRALSLMNGRARPQVATARELLKKAVELDPKSAKAHSLLSFIITLGVQQGWERRQLTLPIALRAANIALSMNPEEAWAHLALGYALMWKHPERALPSLEHALTLNPRLAIGHFLFALALTRSGSPQGVLERAELASRLSPFDLLTRGNAGVYNSVRATASFVVGRYREGAEFARKAITESARLAPAYRQLLVNCALAGNIDEAKTALQTLKRVAPDISLPWIQEELRFSRIADQKSYVEAFRLAGLT
jgi:tetratricopeptide (TPR) repeat protein